MKRTTDQILAPTGARRNDGRYAVEEDFHRQTQLVTKAHPAGARARVRHGQHTRRRAALIARSAHEHAHSP